MFSAAVIAVACAFLFRQAVMVEAGRFMAPEANHMQGVADVVILEGTEFLYTGMVSKGMELLVAGKAKRMAIVLQGIPPNSMRFAFSGDYPSSVRRELQNLGLKDSAFIIIVTPVREPITLTSARDAMEALSRDGVKSAILVSPGFHMRRSFLVYRYLFAPLNVSLYPVAYFGEYQLADWWHDDIAVRDFIEELVKLLLYVAKGYIPLKFS